MEGFRTPSIGAVFVAIGVAMMKQLLEILHRYRFLDRAILFLRLFVGVLIALHIIDKLQTYNFVLTGYPALLFESSWATFVIFTLLEAVFAVMIFGEDLAKVKTFALNFREQIKSINQMRAAEAMNRSDSDPFYDDLPFNSADSGTHFEISSNDTIDGDKDELPL